MELLMKKLEKLELDISNLHNTMKEVKALAEENVKNMERVEDSAKNMDRHIEFVEVIWRKIKSPFYSALAYVSPSSICDA